MGKAGSPRAPGVERTVSRHLPRPWFGKVSKVAHEEKDLRGGEGRPEKSRSRRRGGVGKS